MSLEGQSTGCGSMSPSCPPFSYLRVPEQQIGLSTLPWNPRCTFMIREVGLELQEAWPCLSSRMQCGPPRGFRSGPRPADQKLAPCRPFAAAPAAVSLRHCSKLSLMTHPRPWHAA